MASKRRISLKECADLVRSGMGTAELARHYRLPSSAVKKLLLRLVDAGTLTHQELCECSTMYKRMTEGCEERTDPRLDLSIPLVVRDLDSSMSGIVRDLAEKGFRTAGINCGAGEKKRLRLSIEAFGNFDPVVVGARCIWTRKEDDSGACASAGFEITDISYRDALSLRRFMDLLVMSHSGEWQAVKPSSDG